MKTTVVNEKESTRVPFLRGILIRSLLDTGLAFEDAYSLATRVRDELSDIDEISSQDLRQRIAGLLKNGGQDSALELYRVPALAPARILVHGTDTSTTAFSRGKHERFLQASGLKPERAEQITALLYDLMLAAGITSISTSQLGYSDLPLSAAGGVAQGRGAISRVVGVPAQRAPAAADDLWRGRHRQEHYCDRGSAPARCGPDPVHGHAARGHADNDPAAAPASVLHASSFNAWKELPMQERKDRSREQLVADGYRSQVELLAVACEAVLQRAVEESVPVILEGVHAHPDLLRRVPRGTDAITAHVTLAVLRPKELKARLRGRGVAVPQRRAKRYLDTFDSIWTLQSFLLSEADQSHQRTSGRSTDSRDYDARRIALRASARCAPGPWAL